jgi:phenylpropionate dioxygenase-like ring-hydroxylating dioxygenase large terminal subunit
MPLTAAECQVDDDIRRAETLPARAFVEPEFLERELATVFRTSWQLVPERGDDPRPLEEPTASRGSRVPVSLNGRPLFLQRGWDDDTLRAFPNTCTHAWFPLVLGASRGPTLVCGQHGRRFDCAGRFVSQPDRAVGPGLGSGTSRRPAVRVTAIGGVPGETWTR